MVRFKCLPHHFLFCLVFKIPTGLTGARVSAKRWACPPLRLSGSVGYNFESRKRGNVNTISMVIQHAFPNIEHNHCHHIVNVSETICHPDGKLYLVVYGFNPSIGQSVSYGVENGSLVAFYLQEQ